MKILLILGLIACTCFACCSQCEEEEKIEERTIIKERVIESDVIIE